MNNKLLTIIAASLTILTAVACGKDDDNPVVVNPVAGKGGNVQLRVNTFHHSRRIDSITVFIKYNTQDAPGNGIYDDSARVVKSAADTVAVFSGLKAGKYYFYGNGWDPIINQGVHGGLPYTITDTLVTPKVFTLPVSED